MSALNGPSTGALEGGNKEESLDGRIRRLVESQPYAVLCTQGQGQPYGSLVAYAITQDLGHAVFATPKATRKFRLLSECDHVALVIDNRPDFPNQLMEVEGVTATGRAFMVEQGDEFGTGRQRRLFSVRHDRSGDLQRETFLAVLAQDPGQLCHLRGGEQLRRCEIGRWVHSHVQRGVIGVGETTFALV